MSTDHESPQRQVMVSGFYMSKYEVTQKEYAEVMGTNPSRFNGPNLTVETVRWYDAIEYCNMRSEKEGLIPAYTIDKNRTDTNNTAVLYDDLKWTVTWNRNANGYRLPTEAEWEYACRAGTTTVYNTGRFITKMQANYLGKGTKPVGSFRPNAWGLYDMHGNVEEWCWDWYGNYSRGAQTDPLGAFSGNTRMIRGGGWRFVVAFVRSAGRNSRGPDYSGDDLGFRVVRNAQ